MAENAQEKCRATEPPRPSSSNRKKHCRKFQASFQPQDLLETQAVRLAQKKLRENCLHPCGWQQLRATLSAADKGRKPTTRGEKCIAVPPGTPQKGSVLATWLPCLFIAEYFPNGVAYSFAILELTEVHRCVEKKKPHVFVVLMSDCFLVPHSFSADFDMNFAPNAGVYVIETKLGDTYVGSSCQEAGSGTARRCQGLPSTHLARPMPRAYFAQNT